MNTQKNCFPLFQRRKDLTIQKRFLIAYIVLYQNAWGTVSRLSRKYNVSRTFIYENASLFSDIIQADTPKAQCLDQTDATMFMLSARLEGKCSIPSISTLMKRRGIPFNSVGSISQTLKNIGETIGCDLNVEHVSGFSFSVCSDEVFSKQVPILITLDPISLLILKIQLSDNRKKEAWVGHFQAIKAQNIKLSQLTSDEGVGILSARNEELSDIERQSDTFHAVAHRLGLYANRFYQIACKAIAEEFRFKELQAKAKTKKTRNKYLEKHIQAKSKADKTIDCYDNFVFIYHCLLECLQNFDKTGKLKDVEKVKSDFDTAIEYLKQLNIGSLSKEITSIENCKSDLFLFYKTAKNITNSLAQIYDDQTLALLCLSWQNNKNIIKSKNTERKKKLVRKERYLLNQIEEQIGDGYKSAIEFVYGKLDCIIQSSAAVECINSLLRFYLNGSKNQVTQEFLNLFMFFHNHRRFTNGKRKGKTPMEIATNTSGQSDWLELMLKQVG